MTDTPTIIPGNFLSNSFKNDNFLGINTVVLDKKLLITLIHSNFSRELAFFDKIPTTEIETLRMSPQFFQCISTSWFKKKQNSLKRMQDPTFQIATILAERILPLLRNPLEIIISSANCLQQTCYSNFCTLLSS